MPTEVALFKNYPDPFNPSTVIRYQLPEGNRVTLKIYNVLGQEVATLVNGTQDAGYKSVQFNADALPNGVYFYRLQVGAFYDVKKMIVAK